MQYVITFYNSLLVDQRVVEATVSQVLLSTLDDSQHFERVNIFCDKTSLKSSCFGVLTQSLLHFRASLSNLLNIVVWLWFKDDGVVP